MAERSLLLTEANRALVRAGLKTQTRRVIVPQPISVIHEDEGYHIEWGKYQFDDYFDLVPYARYAVGDELWMLEPYRVKHGRSLDNNLLVHYQDDDWWTGVGLTKQEWDKWRDRKYPYRNTSSRFMYKSLARRWVKVIRWWVEQVQDISEADAFAEGVYDGTPCLCDCGVGVRYCIECGNRLVDLVGDYEILWDSINKKRGYGWDVNPWVFCYEWEVMEK